MMQLPNVVYLHSHDTGRLLSPYGHAVQTPHVQRFAEQGVLFRQAFCANPTCSPSRASLMTGRWPHRNGMLGLAHRGFELGDYRQTWLTTFRELGYRTAIAGQEHVGLRRPGVVEQGLGFDLDLRQGNSDGDAAAACAFIAQPHDQPFFLDAGFFETHRTGKAGTDVQWHNGEASPLGDPRYVRPPAPLPDTPATRADFADFAVAVQRLDALYGRILDALDRAGLAERTIVLITTDHGIAFPGMKCSLTDHGLGVAMMMRGPAAMGLAGGRVIDAMVSHVDVYPTLCELLGAAIPEGIDGRSMTRLLTGEADPARADALHEAVFAQVNYHAAYEPKRCVRTARHKYIRRFHGRATPVLANCDDSVSKDAWLDAGAGEREAPAEALYDLALDPNEADNLAASPAHAAVLDAMRRRLDRWMREADDPILAGPIPLPRTGKVNRHADRSATREPVTGETFDPWDP